MTGIDKKPSKQLICWPTWRQENGTSWRRRRRRCAANERELEVKKAVGRQYPPVFPHGSFRPII